MQYTPFTNLKTVAVDTTGTVTLFTTARVSMVSFLPDRSMSFRTGNRSVYADGYSTGFGSDDLFIYNMIDGGAPVSGAVTFGTQPVITDGFGAAINFGMTTVVVPNGVIFKANNVKGTLYVFELD